VRQAALRGLTPAATWRYEPAQAALSRVARSETATLEDRLLAIEGLGQAARLTFLGNFEDRALPWTLVLLLDDGDAKIRAAAIGVLEKGAHDRFGFDPAAAPAERKAAVESWKYWCRERVGECPAELLKR